MRKTNNNYAKDFKHKALELLNIEGNTVQIVAKSLGVPASTLDGWKRKADSDSSQSIKNKGHSEEYLALKKKVKRLEMENEILKKAAAFFAKEQF